MENNQTPNSNYNQNNEQQSYQNPMQSGQYASSQNVYPAQKIKKPIYKKWWFWLIIIVLFLVIAGSILSGGTESSESYTQPITQAETQSSESSDNNSTTASTVDAGTSVTVDGLEISYISCDTNYTDYEDYAGPSDGNRIIRAEFEFKNISDSDCSLSYFDCYADGAKCDEYFYADDYSSPALETISPGRIFNSVVYFEVPENAENVEIEMETNMWTEDKIIFNVK